MRQPKTIDAAGDQAQRTYPNLPNHAATEAEFLALVDEGLADLEAGRTVSLDAVAADLRRKHSGKA